MWQRELAKAFSLQRLVNLFSEIIILNDKQQRKNIFTRTHLYELMLAMFEARHPGTRFPRTQRGLGPLVVSRRSTTTKSVGKSVVERTKRGRQREGRKQKRDAKAVSVSNASVEPGAGWRAAALRHPTSIEQDRRARACPIERHK